MLRIVSSTTIIAAGLRHGDGRDRALAAAGLVPLGAGVADVYVLDPLVGGTVAAVAAVASGHAVPMRLRDDVVGALNVFGTKPGVLNEEDLPLAQALADVATNALIQDRATADRNLVNGQLQHALASRAVTATLILEPARTRGAGVD